MKAVGDRPVDAARLRLALEVDAACRSSSILGRVVKTVVFTRLVTVENLFLNASKGPGP